MALSSFLLKGDAGDADLDKLFAKTPAPAPQPKTAPAKRTTAADLFDVPEATPHGPAPALNGKGAAEKPVERKRKSAKRSAVDREILAQGAAEQHQEASPLKKRKKRKEVVENGKDPLKVYGFEEKGDAEPPAEIVHESLLPGYTKTKASKGTKRKREEADAEAPGLRSGRTTFVGNVPLACVTSKLSKALQQHLQSTLPDAVKQTAKYESIRFRSLPLAAPISEKTKKTKTPSDAPNHADKRTAAFKSRGGLLGSTAQDEDDAGARQQEKEQRFLTAAQKRKVAAITGEVNSNAESCVAFVVWDSAETARAVITSANGTDFEGRTLRVDAVRDPSAKEGAAKELAPEEKRRLADEERRTIYIGGLDFQETEQKLRDWVESTLVRERGEPEESAAWVERVRIVRDSSTGLGKGFAYVLMQDADCVDELLALPPEQIKLSKRKLRLQRCKSAARLEVEAQREAKKAAAKETRKAEGKLAKTAARKVAKRDPQAVKAKAAELEGLSKEDRKAVKASDADRLARRAAKKQAKVLEERKERKRANRSAKAARP